MVIIPSPSFDALFPDEKLARAALMYLEELGRLAKKKGARPPTMDNKEWAEIFVKIDNGRSKYRAIKFRAFRPSGPETTRASDTA